MTPQNDLDETLATPRFDAVEADTAQPVVPLAEVREERAAGRQPRRARTYMRGVGSDLRRAWPVAIAVALLAASVVVGMTAFVRHRQSAQEATVTQPAPAPPSPAVTDASQSARNDTAARPRVERVEVAPRRARQPERPPVADATPDAMQVLALFGDGRDDDRGRDKDRKAKKEHKHGRDGDDEEDFKPRNKDSKRKQPRLVDVITDNDE